MQGTEAAKAHVDCRVETKFLLAMTILGKLPRHFVRHREGLACGDPHAGDLRGQHARVASRLKGYYQGERNELKCLNLSPNTSFNL